LALSERLNRLVASLRTVFARPPAPSRSSQRLFVAGSVVLFVGAAITAARRLPAPGEVRLSLLVPVRLLGVPASVLVNALEFPLSARMAATRAPLPRAAIVMLLARAASLMPMPCGTTVRVGAPKQARATHPRAILATGALGFSWTATTLTAASTPLVAAAADARGWAALLGALAATGVALLLALPDHGACRGLALVGKALAAGFGMVVAGVLGLSLILLALGYPISGAQAAVLTIAEVLAMALALEPGGIGVREIVAGALGATVGLPASIGVTATVTDRLVESVVLAPVGLAVWLRLRPSLELEPVDRPHVSPEALP
jgi:hypothetical protein